MSLVDYDDSSSTNSESDDDDDVKQLQKNIASNKSHLPSATQLLDASTSGKQRKASEIFGNPFLEAERAKTALLEKHVKMVVVKDVVDTMNGRKICWSNRRGRCRFGSSCQYAHVSDLIVEPKPPHKDADIDEEYLIMPAPTLHSNNNSNNSNASPSNQLKRANFGDAMQHQPHKKTLK